jgi:hypothetical protein
MQQQSAFQRRKNFFERKRFLNYQAHNPMDFQNKPLKKPDDYDDNEQQAQSSSYPLEFGNENHNQMNHENYSGSSLRRQRGHPASSGK